MKKFIFLLVVGISILSFSITAYGQQLDFKGSGYIRVRSDLFQNIASTSSFYGGLDSDFLPTGGAFNRTGSYMDERGRLKFTASAGKELSGVIYFEMDSDRWGDVDGTRNKMGFWGADRAAVEIKHAYIDVAVPYFGIPVPMSFTLGVQQLDTRSAFLYKVDGAGITGNLKLDPVTIKGLWAKAIEGRDAAADDDDLYGLIAEAKIEKNTLGAYGFFFNMNSYPLPLTTIPAYGDSTDDKAHMWWLGLYQEGNIGPFFTVFDFAYDWGKVEKIKGAPKPDVDYRGWAGRLTVDYPWEKFTFGLGGMYATGADQKKTDARGLPGNTTPFGTTSRKVGAFAVMPSGKPSYRDDLIVYGFGEELGLGENFTTSGRSGEMSRGGFGGTWFVKSYATYKAAPWHRTMVQVMYVGDTTKNGNTIGNARTASGLPRDDKSIGVSLYMGNDFQIYKNLVFSVLFGYLIPGKALESFDTVRHKNVRPDDPWQIGTKLRYDF